LAAASLPVNLRGDFGSRPKPDSCATSRHLNLAIVCQQSVDCREWQI
jgi:hypothetical protein